MTLARRLVGGLGVAAAAGAGLLSAGGLVGAVWGWADAANNFIPVWLVMGWIGAAVVRLALPPGRIRTASLISAAAAVVISGAPMAWEMTRTRPQTQEPANLTLLTFNRWWSSPHLDREIALIRNSGADLVTLQEADRIGLAARRSLSDVYPYQLFCGKGCDTAILSKRPILANGKEAEARWPGGSRFMWVRTTAPDGRPVTVATIHPYWPIPPRIQRGQRAYIAQLAHALPMDELILAGDFNLTPWTFAMRRMDPTLAPLTRRTHGLLTFPATWPLPFLAIDQVYAAPAWKTVEIRRMPESGSDHYPVLARFRR